MEEHFQCILLQLQASRERNGDGFSAAQRILQPHSHSQTARVYLSSGILPAPRRTTEAIRAVREGRRAAHLQAHKRERARADRAHAVGEAASHVQHATHGLGPAQTPS